MRINGSVIFIQGKPYRKFQARYGEGLAYDYGFLSGILKWLLGILIFLLLLVPEREIIKRCRDLRKLAQSGSQESECKVGASDHVLKEPLHKLHKRTSRFAYTMEKYQRCMWMFAGIGMAVVAAWLFIACFDVSLASFPAVWSDFAAWKELGARWSQEIMTLFCDAKEPFMLPYWGAFFKGLAWSIGCYALYVLQRCGCFS